MVYIESTHRSIPPSLLYELDITGETLCAHTDLSRIDWTGLADAALPLLQYQSMAL